MARKRRGGVRTGSKRVTEKIRRNAEYLKEHPEHAVPQCRGSCPLFCFFKRARKGVQRRHGMIGDDDKLERWSRWGNKLARAYAATLRIADSEEGALEYFQNVQTHQGTVPIAPWGNAPTLAMVGMQHREDRTLRLLEAVPFVSSDEAVYATEHGLVCAHDGTPPEESVQHLLDQLPVEKASPSLARCPHVPDEWTDATYIELQWKNAGLRIRVCEDCSQGNLLTRIQTVMVAKEIRNLVNVRVQLPRLEDPEGGPSPELDWRIPSSVMDAYASGEIPDTELIEEARRARRFALEAIQEPMIVRGRQLHRPPFGQVLDRLGPSETERALLEEALSGLGRPLVLERETPIELMEKLWTGHGRQALASVLGEGHAEALYDPEADAEALERLMETVQDRIAQQQVEARLPTYESVPSPVDLADEVARAYLREGRSRAQQILNSTPDPEHEAVALSLVEALDLPGTAWTVDPRTGDMAEHLESYARDLLEAEGDAYHDALGRLLKATGSTQSLERVDGG